MRAWRLYFWHQYCAGLRKRPAAGSGRRIFLDTRRVQPSSHRPDPHTSHPFFRQTDADPNLRSCKPAPQCNQYGFPSHAHREGGASESGRMSMLCALDSADSKPGPCSGTDPAIGRRRPATTLELCEQQQMPHPLFHNSTHHLLSSVVGLIALRMSPSSAWLRRSRCMQQVQLSRPLPPCPLGRASGPGTCPAPNSGSRCPQAPECKHEHTRASGVSPKQFIFPGRAGSGTEVSIPIPLPAVATVALSCEAKAA